MDEENERETLGAYDNMERPNIRPNFAGEAIGNSAVNFFRNTEESAKSKAENIGKKASEKVAEKVAEKGLDAATGGVGGKVLKAAEKTGSVSNSMPNNPRSKGKVAIKKALPLVLILTLIMGGFGIIGTSTFSLFGKAFSAIMKRNSDTSTSVNHKVTDYQINNTQLGGNNGKSEYGDVVFEDIGFSNYQIQSFKQAGLEYVESEDGTKALVHNEFDGSKTYIVANSKISGTTYYGDEVVGEGGDEYLDAGASDGKTEEERIHDLEIALNVGDGGKVVAFSDALKNFNIKNAYIAATDAYRGGMGAWYSDTANTTTKRLGISLNNWQNYEEVGDNERAEQIVINTASKKSANDNADVKSVAYDELVNEVAEKSSSAGCGFDSAASAVGGVANAGETYKQVTAGALIMEAIDKTIAGYGNQAPMNAILNLVFKAGGTDTESMHNLFGGTKLNQSSDDILLTSAQANLSSEGSVNLDALGDEQSEAETCMYVENVNNYESKGIIAKIGSMFKGIGGWIKNKVGNIASFFTSIFSEASEATTSAIVSAVDPAVAKFNQMKEHVYLSGNDSKLIGEAMVSSAELISNEMSKSVTATMPGDTGAVKTAYRAQQEVIAEKADYDRTTMSPFDPSSENTFLGKIAYSLIPFATSNTSISLTSTITKLGSILSNAATSLLPTSNAVSETELEISQGDCAFANSVAAFSNARCHNYQTFNLTSLMQNPTEIFNRVAEMRKDEEDGYKFGINAEETGAGQWASKLRVDYNEEAGRALDAADYGNKPLNPEENNLESHWGTGDRVGIGEAHGCESDWQWEDDLDRPIYGPGNVIVGYKRLYHFDQPSEWKYTRLTNFEYVGYKTGFPNLTSANSVGEEGAKNDEDPGTCQLDLKTDRQKQPVININSALGMFILLSGQRTSEVGVADQNNIDVLVKTDFLHGRLNPCYVTNGSQNLLCDEFLDEGGWVADEDRIAQNQFLSRLVSGSAYVNFTDSTDMMKKGYVTEDVFKDPTLGDAYFTEETKLYSAYIQLIEWMEANNLIVRAADSVALEKYYDENPLDNSYAGILARYSGYNKDTVLAVLDLVDYSEWLANYDPSNLYPLAPKEDETILYDNPEIIASEEPVVNNNTIIYDELRNRTVAA